MPPTSTYLSNVETSLAQGNATEHTHRPALHALLSALYPDLLITNEPRHVACGAPDFVISKSLNIGALTVGYIETKDVGKTLDQVERTPQLKRYLASLENLLLTDYLEFRWYVNGERRRTVRLAELSTDGKLKKVREGAASLEALVGDFIAHQPQEITSPRDLAQRMARLTHLIRDILFEAFNRGEASTLLQGWREAFARVLVADLDQPEKTGEFADMLAQTLAYGLFSARLRDFTPGFTRQEAQTLIPRTNPFLRDFFYQITGPQLDDEPFASFVEDLVSLLDHTDMNAILRDFGKHTRQEDPVVHFYETFLAAYDPKLRESRGVYFTPEPVVSYIVRSVDYLLRTRFNLPEGLADTSKVTIRNTDPARVVKGTDQPRKKAEIHRVLVLDPAAGTGTFLYGVVDLIRQRFIEQGNAGMWPGYVREHLLPRLFGFELLMAPYAVAHFKLALQLAGQDLPEPMRKDWAYDFASDERIRVFLTNTLEAPHEHTGLPLFTQFLATETAAANRVKQELPIMVVLGNPPYSGHSSNKGEWIGNLLRGKLPDGQSTANYYEVDGQPLGEKNPKWLQDDYVKFIRWAQWRIEQTGAGILAFITNHGYLDNPTFRGMRQALMQTFDEIYILDLHGNAKKKETAPDGSPDENVFDIQQGVAIGIFVKQPGKSNSTQVKHADLFGSRQDKYTLLYEQDLETTIWQQLSPKKPFYLFLLHDVDLLGEYQSCCRVSDMFPLNSMGITTGRDKFATGYNRSEIRQKISFLKDLSIDQNIRAGYDLKDSSSFSLSAAQEWARTVNPDEFIIPFAYRCFDQRYVIYSPKILARVREEVCQHQIGLENCTLVTFRAIREAPWQHIFLTNLPIAKEFISSLDNCYAFPLYLYRNTKTDKQINLLEISPWPPDPTRGNRTPNLNPTFVTDFSQKLDLPFDPHKSPNLSSSFGPEDLFHYIYAIFYSPTYRTRYAEFLKIDFPRVPLTSNPDLFWSLASLGGQLVSLHLLESPQLSRLITRYPIPGGNLVEKAYPKYLENQQRVYISKDQYFEGVPPKVWDFHIGGYQVCEKWLKDRRGRQLTYDDLTHYQKVVVSLQETIRLMAEIDQAIDAHGGWPIR